MAVTARRTLANVKSSAMRPRHPEVPNLMGEVVMGRYSRPEGVESRKLKVEKRGKLAWLGERMMYERRAEMKRAKQGRIVLVTCATLTEARRIARSVVG